MYNSKMLTSSEGHVDLRQLYESNHPRDKARGLHIMACAEFKKGVGGVGGGGGGGEVTTFKED